MESYIHVNTPTELAIEVNKSKQTCTFKEVITEAYHSYKDVFDKENFNELLPHQLWDHTIELLSEDHMINCKMHNLMNNEQKELELFLEENFKSGQIHLLKSLFTFVSFFIKKKDGKLCPVQNY
ncbi:hypothetical protein HD554DRAFT_2016203 [Boletus coccyginus]|nr:hypothetical protein HD554DRAFT_2016203 [Boletus coccyginus]